MEERLNNHLERNNDPDFDLDQFIAEQAESEYEQRSHTTPHENPVNRKRSLGVLVIALTVLFLGFNEWSPREAFGTLFGAVPTEPVVEVVAGGPSVSTVMVDEIRIAREEARASRIAQLGLADETTSAELAEAQAAMEAAIERLAQLEHLSHLGERFNFDFGDQFEFNFGPDGQSFSDYRQDLGITDEATQEELENMIELYFSNVPSSFVKEMQEKNPDITTDEILEAFNDQN